MSYPGCGCPGNWWNNLPQSVCGSFEEPTVPDEGRCGPYRVKLSCEAPTLPVAQCNDENYETVYQPDEQYPFGIIASLFDECCEAITDENGDTITLFLVMTGGYDEGVCVT